MNTVKRNYFYPVADRIPYSECEKLKLEILDVCRLYRMYSQNNVHARYTGEKRCPRKGEWYLSGAIVQAYRAKNDLSTPYHIAELVKTKTEQAKIITCLKDGVSCVST